MAAPGAAGIVNQEDGAAQARVDPNGSRAPRPRRSHSAEDGPGVEEGSGLQT
jgi:hypothetical protein